MAGNKRIASIDENGDVTFNHQDHQLSGNLRTDSSGAVVKRIEYYPFGRERLSSGSYNKIFNQYTDQYKDGESELYYYNQRYYNPVLGRFISGDPLYLEEMDERGMDTQELNVFGYVRNNPLKYTDSTGNYIDATGAEHAGPANPSASASEFASPEAYEAGIPGDAGYDPAILNQSITPSVGPLDVATGVGFKLIGKGLAKSWKSLSGLIKLLSDKLKPEKGDIKVDPKLQKTIDKIKTRQAEHIKKLEEYKKDPSKFDNKGHLKNAPDPQKVIDGRIRHLEKEIKNFDKQIDDLM